MKKLTKSVLIASAIAVAAFAASAQGMMGGDHKGSGRMEGARMEKMAGRQMDGLKTKLNLTAEQQAAWTTFAASMKPGMGMGMKGKRMDHAEMSTLSTPERLDKMTAMHKQHTAEKEAMMTQRNEAIKTFYAVLNADQKKVFDAEHARMEKGHHGKGDGSRSGAGKGPQAKQP